MEKTEDQDDFIETFCNSPYVPKQKTGRRKQTPHAKLKSDARKLLTNWKVKHHIRLKLLPYFVGKIKSQDGKRGYQVGKKGTGDDLIGLLGFTAMIEYKAGNDTQKPDQRDMQADWEATGQPYILVRKPTDLIDGLVQAAAQRGRIF